MADKKKVRKLRCSALDALWCCTPSVLADGPDIIRISRSGKPAEVGKLCHDCGEGIAKETGYDIKQLASRYELDEEDVEGCYPLLNYGQRAWDELKQYFPQPQVEAHVTGPEIIGADGNTYQIAGTIDVCSPSGGDQAIFLDWKSGYIDDGYHQQMAGYAYLLWNFMGRPDKIQITGIVVFMRHRYYRVLKYTAGSLAQWEHDLLYNVLGSPDEYRPSTKCRFCDLFATCQARQAIVNGTIDTVLGVRNPDDDPGWYDRGKQVLSQLTEDNKDNKTVGEMVSDLIFRIRLTQRAIDDAKAMLRDAVNRVGPIRTTHVDDDDGNDAYLTLREVSSRFINDNRSAMAVLRQFLSDSQIADCSKLSVPKLLETYAKNTQKGTKKDARERMTKTLEDAGLIGERISKRLEEVELPNEGETNGNDSSQPTGKK